MKLQNGDLCIPAAYLLHQALLILDDKDKKDFIDSLSCEESVIKNVMDQVLDGFTELGSSSYRDGELFNARLEIAKRSSDVAKEVIEKLTKDLAVVNKEHNRITDAVRALMRSYDNPPPHLMNILYPPRDPGLEYGATIV